MNSQLIITFAILFIAILLFLSGRVRPDLVALLVLFSLGATGILTAQEAFSGFSRSAVITILSIFILAEGLNRTGVTSQIGNLLVRWVGKEERSLVLAVTLVGGFLSLFMNNIAAASVLIPAVSGAANQSKISPSKLLMPLAFGTILGGMATLLTTANIVASGLLRDSGLPGFGLLDFAPLGLPLVALGTIYLVTIGYRWLPRQSPKERLLEPDQEQSDLFEVYKLGERLIAARIPRNSGLVGLTLQQSKLRESFELNLIAVERNERLNIYPSPGLIFKPGDILLFEGRPEELQQKEVDSLLEILPPDDWLVHDFISPGTVTVEVVLSPRSQLIGQTLSSVLFREKYEMNVLAIWRSGRPIRTRLSNMPLEFGDALLLQGNSERLPVLRADPDLIVLAEEITKNPPVPIKAWIATAILVGTLLLAATGVLPYAEVLLGGSILMILVGILTMDQAYQAIDWKTVFLVAGMLPMGIALSKTGAASLIAERLLTAMQPSGSLALLAGLFLLGVLMTQAVNGAAVAAILTPIAIVAAQQSGLDPRSMVMAVAISASMAFITPLGHPVNILVMGIGGYQFKDYLKVGLPLVMILFIAILVLLPVIWPL
jgi:di/tricarboxylate transporter